MVAGLLEQSDQLQIEQGQYYPVSFTVYSDNPPVTVIDLTGYTAVFKVRVPDKNGEVVFSASTSDYLSIDAPNGVVSLSIPGGVTGDIPVFNRGWFELVITPSSGANYALRVIEGYVICKQWVTQ